MHVGYRGDWRSTHYRDSDHPSAPWRNGGTDGCARDWGDAASDPQAVYDELVGFADGPGHLLDELIWRDVGWSNGVRYHYTGNDHYNHCHAGIRPAAQLPI